MINQAYIDFCQTLWSDWCAGSLNLPQCVSGRFQLEPDYAPEPYLRFGQGLKPLYLLFTNPGAGMPFQHRDAVLAGKSCICQKMSYFKEASLELGKYYCKELPKRAAWKRINASADIRDKVGADCIVQFETLPFHSKKLSDKQAIPKLVRENECLQDYISYLKETLKDISAVALSAVSTSMPISVESINNNRWLKWQAELLGLNITNLKQESLAEKDGKITSAFIYQKMAKCTRGLVLTMGGNNFPTAKGRNIIASVLKNGNTIK
jgi:hypothetical protein